MIVITSNELVGVEPLGNKYCAAAMKGLQRWQETVSEKGK
jgi:hypothetical protein